MCASAQAIAPKKPAAPPPITKICKDEDVKGN